MEHIRVNPNAARKSILAGIVVVMLASISFTAYRLNRYDEASIVLEGMGAKEIPYHNSPQHIKVPLIDPCECGTLVPPCGCDPAAVEMRGTEIIMGYRSAEKK